MKTISIPPTAEASSRARTTPVRAGVCRAYLGLAGLFLLGVLAQAFLAGAGIFVSGTWMVLSALLLFLAMVQPVVLYKRGVLPILSALHPVNALLLFVLPIWLIARVRRAMRAVVVSSQ